MSGDDTAEGAKEPAFDATRAEFFEAIGHPLRIKIIQTLGHERMGSAGLKKEIGIESSGHLAFHLAKLSRMVALGQDGLYGLTAEGYDALKMVEAVTQSGGDERKLAVRTPTRSNKGHTALLVVLVIGLLVLASFAAYQQSQINGVSSRLQTTVTSTATVTSIQTGSPSVTGGTEMVNGTMKVAFLESGVDTNSAWYNVRNDGETPLYISFVSVDGTPAFFNGTSGVTLAVSNNPIPPGGTTTVEAIYPASTSFHPPATIRFTIVNAQGLEVSDQINLVGGVSTAVTTTPPG